MIVIRIISGSHAGKSRRVRDGMFQGRKVDALQLLRDLVRLGSHWEIDYSHADENETIDWGRAEIANRVLRALLAGRPVRFMGIEYRANLDQVAAVSQSIEDAIVTSGYWVKIEYDDGRGVSIETGEREHKLQ